MENRITALIIQKRNPNRVNVFLDGEFCFGASRVVTAWLQIGQVLTEEKIADLQEKDVREIAYQAALRLISRRPRSIFEIKERLERKELDKKVVRDVLDLLIEKNYLDDSRFADMWVENRSAFKPRGTRALRLELKRKGIGEDLISQTLENIDEPTLLKTAAIRYMNRLSNCDWLKFRNRLYGFLARRGFSYQDIVPVVRNLWDEKQVGSPNLKKMEGN